MAAAVKSNDRMPACTAADQHLILEGVNSLRGAQRAGAEQLLDRIGPKALCAVLHSMRRWYTAQSGVSARRLLAYQSELAEDAMDLDAPIGAYRGFKVDREDFIGTLEGRTLRLPVRLNGGCSSWTLGDELANRFSGAGKGKIGIVVKLARKDGVRAFIAPPERSAAWWNELYARTMGRSFRFKEREYALSASSVIVRVVRVKR